MQPIDENRSSYLCVGLTSAPTTLPLGSSQRQTDSALERAAAEIEVKSSCRSIRLSSVGMSEHQSSSERCCGEREAQLLMQPDLCKKMIAPIMASAAYL
jgi:hypothetical protein